MADYDGDDPLLHRAFSKDTAITTVVHTASDDLAHPKVIAGKFHSYDDHIGSIEQTVSSLR